MKPTSWNSFPKVFFRFAPMGIVEKTSFERNWTTFVNPPFCTALKSPAKMVVWNRPRGIRSKGCFFVSPRWGNSKKRVFNAIGRHSSTRLFALPSKAQQKWWYETDLVEFDPKGVFLFRPDGETRQNEFSTQLDDLGQTGVLRYTVLCALYTIHGTLYSVHYTRYTVLYALCTKHGTLYSVHCALYTPGGVTCANLCWVCAASLSEPLPHYSHILWPIIDPILVTFG